jgi:hypothetical protein
MLKFRSIKWKTVPKNKQSTEFIKYVLQKFKDFDEILFFRP